MTLIQLADVSLTFRVRRFGPISLKEYVVRGLFRPSRGAAIEVRALEHIDLCVGEGDRIGILGPNGAGKSSLLKLIAGIYIPTSGRRVVTGQISSLFDISVGFDMEATGWENIRYRGYLQGETPRSIRAKMEPIAEFSELGDFLNMPVRYYSAGMMVRLAFSIATAIEPEILLVDEALAAGDLAFQTKARQRIRSLISSARSVLVVSHDLASLAQLCESIVWLDHGRIRMLGPADRVIEAYTQHTAALDQRPAA
jgi:ABC-type polysaccharide/polyol phosphate transport system ATPase subunit